jgi:hypothetical protein
MTGDNATRDGDEQHGRVRRLFVWHRRAYVGVVAALIAANIAIGGGWWSFWPMCAWGLVFSLHFFYYKSVTIDEAWVEERTDDMRLRSYDLSHISDIEDRVEQRDASVCPPSEWKNQR